MKHSRRYFRSNEDFSTPVTVSTRTGFQHLRKPLPMKLTRLLRVISKQELRLAFDKMTVELHLPAFSLRTTDGQKVRYLSQRHLRQGGRRHLEHRGYSVA